MDPWEQFKHFPIREEGYLRVVSPSLCQDYTTGQRSCQMIEATIRCLQWRKRISEDGSLSLNGLRNQVSQIEANLNDLRQSFLGLHSSWEVPYSSLAHTWYIEIM